MKNIVLIGMPGCGKSTLGRCLAERLGRDFIDADPEIEKDSGKTIPELFAVSEDFFRKQETRTTKRLSALQDKVLAMGGGVVLRQENIISLKENGLIIFLDRSPEDIRAHYTVKTYEDLKMVGGDLLINCTPVGMFPKTDASPVDGTVMDHFAAAVDIIYNPAETKFMKLARQQGKTAVNGLFMLVAQAVAADEIWLERKLDAGLIADVTDIIARLL